MTIEILKYTLGQKRNWDEFIATSKNATFLFQRNYMDYHADRFTDHSLLFVDGKKILALLPATIKDSQFISHGGLTYGGFLANKKMKAALMLEIFSLFIDYLKKNSFSGLVYKAIPYIYHRVPSDEDLYALFRHDAKLIRRDISSTIDLRSYEGFKRSIKRAQEANLIFKETNNLEEFFKILAELLSGKYDTVPTHTVEEMKLLAARFPNNIKLYAAFKDAEMLAGVLMYEMESTVHAQYIASTDLGRELSAIDFVLYHLLTQVYKDKKYFDFGISTTNQGRELNLGLIDYKEHFAARATVYDTYTLEIIS